MLLWKLFFLAPGFMKNKVLYFHSSNFFCLEIQELNYVNIFLLGLNNEDIENINQK